MELLPQTGVFQPVHHGQHMNSSLANQLSTIPQQNVMVPTIKPTVMVNPYEAGANNYMPQKFCFQPPSRPQVSQIKSVLHCSIEFVHELHIKFTFSVWLVCRNMNGIGMRGEVNYKIIGKKRIKILANVGYGFHENKFFVPIFIYNPIPNSVMNGKWYSFLILFPYFNVPSTPSYQL